MENDVFVERRVLNGEKVQNEARKILARHWFARGHCNYSVQVTVDIGGDTVKRRKIDGLDFI